MGLGWHWRLASARRISCIRTGKVPVPPRLQGLLQIPGNYELLGPRPRKTGSPTGDEMRRTHRHDAHTTRRPSSGLAPFDRRSPAFFVRRYQPHDPCRLSRKRPWSVRHNACDGRVASPLEEPRICGPEFFDRLFCVNYIHLGRRARAASAAAFDRVDHGVRPAGCGARRVVLRPCDGDVTPHCTEEAPYAQPGLLPLSRCSTR